MNTIRLLYLCPHDFCFLWFMVLLSVSFGNEMDQEVPLHREWGRDQGETDRKKKKGEKDRERGRKMKKETKNSHIWAIVALQMFVRKVSIFSPHILNRKYHQIIESSYNWTKFVFFLGLFSWNSYFDLSRSLIKQRKAFVGIIFLCYSKKTALFSSLSRI